MKKSKTFDGWYFHTLKKTFLIMRITVILLLVGFLQVFAINSYSQKTKFSVDLKNVTIEAALDVIENQSEFFFMYNEKLIETQRIVNIEATDVNVEELLNQLFDDGSVEYSISNRKIFLVPNVIKETQQDQVLTGKVVDMSQRALPGVTVVIKGTTNGTVTNTDGTFSLSNVPPDATIVFSFVGMKTHEIVFSGQTEINITLIEDAIGIEEVIAVGYATQKKVNLTGSISSIKFDDELNNRPITDATQALSGKVTGVWVSQNSGKPGSDGAQLRVRGWGTMNNSNPLVIIDGVEGAFEQINPTDIESISVLKDAASAAIYGSKAANGVILITTKMGKKDEKMEVDLTSYYGIQSLGRRYDMIDNSVEYMQLWNQALANEGSSPLFPDYMISAFENGTDKYKYPNSNFFDELFQTATIQEHNVSIRGGSKNSSSFLSFNYLNQEGMVPNTNSEKVWNKGKFRL